MYKQRTWLWIIGFGYLWLLACAPVFALSNDRDQPLTIKADRASVDDIKGITTYRGNVRVQQGSMQIEADTLVLTYEGRDGERSLTLVAAEGRPARFQQQSDNQVLMKASAERMEFYIQQDMLHLTGKAQVQQGLDSFSGQYMVYDAKRSILTADGGSQGVLVTLQPRKSAPKAERKAEPKHE